MVVFTVENRLKEIGIRKVMGATEMNVMVLLSKHFIKLMFIAAVIAVPFTWIFFENSFLQFHHYKIDIGLYEIGVSLLLMMALGLATILSQTIRAARANPVDTLRSE
jgi:putative ABC transport system permease protein